MTTPTIQHLRDIVLNAKEQKENLSDAELLVALNFSIDRDAFIELSSPQVAT